MRAKIAATQFFGVSPKTIAPHMKDIIEIPPAQVGCAIAIPRALIAARAWTWGVNRNARTLQFFDHVSRSPSPPLKKEQTAKEDQKNRTAMFPGSQIASSDKVSRIEEKCNPHQLQAGTTK